jgi:hypothetical protein
MISFARVALLVALLTLLLPAAPVGAAPPRGTFVGALDDRPALNIAIVTDGRRVTAYVCDNGRRSVWFDGRFRGEAATLRARGRRGSIRLRLERRALVGTASFAGRSFRFRALRALRRAGLWRASVNGPDGRPVEATWIVLRNGRRTGTQVTGTNVGPPPNLNTAEPDVQLAQQDLTAVELEPINLFPFGVSPQLVTIRPAGPQRTGGVTIIITRDGIADVAGVSVRIGGLSATPGRRDPGSDRISVTLPGGIGGGTHDVAVTIPGQGELVKRDALTVVISRA